MTYEEILKYPNLPEGEFRQAIARHEAVTPKPWKHTKEAGYPEDGVDFVCGKECGCEKLTGDFNWHSEDGKIRNDCPIPDPYTGSLGDLAFELKRKANQDYLRVAMYIVREWRFNTHDGKHGSQNFNELLKIAKKNVRFVEDYTPCFALEANEYETITAALLAIEMEKAGTKQLPPLFWR